MTAVKHLRYNLNNTPHCCGMMEAGGFAQWNQPVQYGTVQGSTLVEAAEVMIAQIRRAAGFRKKEGKVYRTRPVIFNLINTPACRAVKTALKKQPDAVLIHKWKNSNYHQGHTIECWLLKNEPVEENKSS